MKRHEAICQRWRDKKRGTSQGLAIADVDMIAPAD